MSNEMQLDGWPQYGAQFGTVAHLHALGQITLMYNYVEMVAGSLFNQCMPTEAEFTDALFHKLNNRDRVDLFSAVIASAEKDAAAREALLHYLLCYNICTENRNILMHALHYSHGHLEHATPIMLTKKASQDPRRELHFEFPLADLRLIADQMYENFQYGNELWRWLVSRDGYRGWMRDEKVATRGPGPLPYRPQKPRKLTPSQHPKDRLTARRRQRPSQE